MIILKDDDKDMEPENPNNKNTIHELKYLKSELESIEDERDVLKNIIFELEEKNELLEGVIKLKDEKISKLEDENKWLTINNTKKT